jgi:hypothetical protein
VHSYAYLHFSFAEDIQLWRIMHASERSSSSSASSNFTAISASDFKFSKLTSLLHTALTELKSLRPALAEVTRKAWQHLMQPNIDEVVEWQKDIRPLLTEIVTHRAAYELPRKFRCRSAV